MRRRKFLRLIGQTSLGLSLGWAAPSGAWASSFLRRIRGARRVAILGGGVAGMSAAHELVERGFEVAVYEAKSIPGGKARSIPVPGTGIDGRLDLPGEHGFRFFAGFYNHLGDTLKRIPFQDNRRGVYDNLVQSQRMRIARTGPGDLEVAERIPVTIGSLVEFLRAIFGAHTGLNESDLHHFAHRLHVFITSCDERRLAEYEKIPWWEFIEADKRSAAYQTYFAKGLTRLLVAMKPEMGSTRTVAGILFQLFLSWSDPFRELDRLLNAPTNEAWLNPWLDYLRSQGVEYFLDSPVQSIDCRDGLITGATVLREGSVTAVEADYYICAIPCEAMAKLVTPELAAADPAFARLGELETRWMTGIQFFLNEDIPIVPGHTIYIDSPWALTSISQKQFWPDVDLSRYGNGRVQGVFSIDISDWLSPGILYGKPANECTGEEIKAEVLAQIEAHLNKQGEVVFDESKIEDWFLDSAIHFPAPGQASNEEPLLINTVDSWKNRPEAVTQVPNLFLASDYVRTNSDLACMEAANEAARRAVNGILEASGSTQSPCRIWTLEEPMILLPEKEIDRLRFRAGLPHIGEQSVSA